MSETKNTSPNTVSRSKVSEDRDLLRQHLLFRTQEKLNESLSDQKINRELQKIELLSGKILDLNEVSQIISDSVQKYEPKFSVKFYTQVYRLMGLPIPQIMPFNKPPEFAIFTNEVVYGRFRNDVLPALQLLNPYVAWGRRKYKHFQLFTDEGLAKLEKFIDDATELMSECASMYEFRQKLHKNFGIGYQIPLFLSEDYSNRDNDFSN